MTTATHSPEVSPLVGTETETPTSAPPAAHIRHRTQTRAFALQDGATWHREHLTRLYGNFDTWNTAYFGGQLFEPYLMLLEPKSARAYGDTSRVSGFGGQLQIRVRPAILRGNKRFRPEPEFAEGRARFAADVLLHELVHQWQTEAIGDDEGSYHGHGPRFRDKANEIGALLGLPPVRTAKARGKDKALPSCAQWPHNVRPADYYLGAVVEVPANGDTDEDEGDDDARDRLDQLIDELASLANPSLVRVLAGVLNRRPILRADDPDGFDMLIGDVAGELEEDRLFALYDMVRMYVQVDEEDEG